MRITGVKCYYKIEIAEQIFGRNACNRFKQKAKNSFEYSKKTDLILRDDIESDGDSEDRIEFKTLKL